jgi:hypothetical protein
MALTDDQGLNFTDPEPARRADGAGSWPLLRPAVALASMLLAAGAYFFGQADANGPIPADRAIVAPPVAQPLKGLPEPTETLTLAPENLRSVSPQAARLWNTGLPFSTEPTPPARAFNFPASLPADYQRALDCLTAAVYYEAGAETAGGQLAVAQVVLNRVRHPAFPKSVCGVVFEGAARATGCQFTFTCDGALARRPSAAGWARAQAVAQAALNGLTSPAVGTATHYHTDWVAPYWAPRLVKVAQIGSHIFYRWPGGWGRPGAFFMPASLAEPAVGKMAPLSTEVTETGAQEPPPQLTLAMIEAPAPDDRQAPVPPSIDLDGANPPLDLPVPQPAVAAGGSRPPAPIGGPSAPPRPGAVANPLAPAGARSSRPRSALPSQW